MDNAKKELGDLSAIVACLAFQPKRIMNCMYWWIIVQFKERKISVIKHALQCSAEKKGSCPTGSVSVSRSLVI